MTSEREKNHIARSQLDLYHKRPQDSSNLSGNWALLCRC